ncbi:hypothetical protein D3C87_1399270 [compost metagenome]
MAALGRAVGQQAANGQAHGAEQADDHAEGQTQMGRAHAVGAGEVDGGPQHGAIGRDDDDRIADDHAAEGRLVAHGQGPQGAERRGLGGAAATGCLAHRQQHQGGQRHAQQAHGHEGQAPARQVAPGQGDIGLHRPGDQHPAEQHGHAAAQRHAHVVEADRKAEALLLEAVGDGGIGGGRQGRLTDADHGAGRQQGGEAARETAGRRGRAPAQDAEDHQVAAIAAVGQRPERDAHDGIEQDEAKADQQADLGVAQTQLGTDRFDHQADQHAVHEGQHVGDHQDQNDIDGVGRAGSRGDGSGGGG